MPDNYGAQYATTAAVPNGGTMWVNPNTIEPSARIQLLDEATQSIEGSTKFAYVLAEEVRQIADSVFGAQGTAVSNSKTESRAPLGRAMGLKNGTEALHAALSVLHVEIQRLRSL